MNMRLYHRLTMLLLSSGAIAAIYVALAQVGFLAAIPPGNVTLIWPPSGLAVAALLVLGNRRASLGIWLGSFVINAWVMSEGEFTATVAAIAAVIALGSLVQSIVAAAAMRRFVSGWPLRADRRLAVRRPALQAIMFAGMMALICVIAATAGVTALWLGGRVAPGTYAATWRTWWLGDWIGIVLLAYPLALLGRWIGRHSESHAIAMWAVDLGMVLTVATFFGARSLESERIAVEFTGAARAAGLNIQKSIGGAQHELEVTDTLFMTEPGVTREQFRAFVQPHLAGPYATPGIQGLGWAPYVAAGDRAAFEAAVRSEGVEGFRIVERDASGAIVPAAMRSAYVVADYIEPLAGNRLVQGLDLASEPLRGAALLQARDTGQVVASAQLKLVADDKPGFLLFWPVYRPGAPAGTPAERRAAIVGFVVGSYRTRDLLAMSLNSPELRDLDLYLFDAGASNGSHPLYISHPSMSDTAVADTPVPALEELRKGWYYATDLDVGGHIWTLIVKPAPIYVGERRTWLPYGALLGGLVITALITVFLVLRERVEQIQRRSDQRFRALIEKSASVVTLVEADGRVIYSSANNQRIFGFNPLHRLGRSVLDVVHPDDRAGVAALQADVLANPGMSYRIEFRGLHNDGSWRWASSVITNLLDDPAVGAIVINTTDITDHKQASLALAASEAKFRSYIEYAPIAVFVTDHTGHYVETNRAAAQLLGCDMEALLRTSIPNVLADEDRDAGLRLFADVVRDGAGEGQFRLKRCDGTFVWVALSAIKIDEDRFVAFCLDISEHKLIEKTLQEKIALEEQIGKIAATAPGGLCSFRLRPDGVACMPYVSPAWEEITGLTWADVREDAAKLFDTFHPDDRERVAQSIQASASALTPWRAEYRARHALRGEIWLEGHSNPVREPDGSILWHGFIADVTERKQGQAREERRRAMLENVVRLGKAISRRAELQQCMLEVYASIRFGLGFDRVGLFLYDAATRQVRGSFGTSRDSEIELCDDFVETDSEDWNRVLSQPDKIFVTDDYGSEFNWPPGDAMHDVKQHALLTASVGEQPVALIAVDNLISGRPFEPEQLEALKLLAGYAGLAIENARWSAELERLVAERTADLSRANLELTKALSSRDEFLATMSHELRTPLNGILALSESLAEQIRGPLNEHQLAWVRAIEASGRHLLALISDILDLSKIEAGQLEMQIEAVSIDAVCQSSLLFVKEIARKKNLRVAFWCDDTSLQVDADERRLKQILVNLLSNAVKFTADGGSVQLEVEADAAQGIVRFVVRDSGIGIAHADLGRLFRPFVQLDSGLDRQYEGTGLGLVLVQRLVELHGGRVSVASAGVPGQGSAFTVALPWRPAPIAAPAAPARANEQPAAPPRAPSRGVVLLAEDNETNIQAVGDYIEFLGYRLVVARDGAEALDRADQERPDIILMDIQMPVLDGLEAIRRLRARADFMATPIVALTALAMPGDRERCLEAGASEYISKPVSLKGLAATIGRLLSEERP